jgi:hypothetical protein
MQNSKWTKIICGLGLAIGLGFFLYSFRTVLNGPHEHRQADSIFAGYFYCTEADSHFLYPHIGPRGATTGVAINEFPVYAYTLGKICQLKGGWDEITPRVVSLLFAILAGLLFWLTLLKKYNLNSKESGSGWPEFLVVFLFLPVNWTFFTIPMPESTALLFYSLAGYLWTAYPQNKKLFLLSSLLFILGFLIRPFYVLFLFFFVPSWIASSVILACCVFVFWFWYRYWDSVVTTSPGYFGIRLQSLQQTLDAVPHALAMLPDRILGHTAVVGLFSFYLVWNKYRKLVLFYIASILMMYILKPTHVGEHAYYLLNAGLFASFAIFLSLPLMTPRQRNWALVIFLIYSFAVTQHNFHSNGNWERTKQAWIENGNLPDDAVVATYLGMNPQWLYYLKKTGYIFEPEEFQGQCPPHATHYLINSQQLNDKGEPKLSLRACPK